MFQYIDFNPLRKKDTSIDCINETNEMLEVLSHLGGDNGTAITPISFENVEAKSFAEQSNADTTSLYDSSVSVTKNNNETNLDVPADITNIKQLNMTEPKSAIPKLTMDQMPELNPNIMPKVDSGVIRKSYTTPANAKNTASVEQVNFTPSASYPAIETTGHAVECIIPTGTKKVGLETTNIPALTSQNPVSLSVASIPNILQSQPQLNKAVRKADETPSKKDKNKEFDISAKLKRLEADLKLVNEVQNILNGISAKDHKINKREADSQKANPNGESAGCDETTTLFELNLKVVDQNSVENEIEGLGKLLKWKANRPKDDCRIRRMANRRKKKKKKKKQMKKWKKKKHKLTRPRRFLGLGIQNFL